MTFYMSSYRESAATLWGVIFRLEGNILFAVLPLCVINCMLLGLVAYSRHRFAFGFSPTGHGLLTLLVSFLVISKVNLAYDRYRIVREQAGRGATILRELFQIVLAFSSTKVDADGDGKNARETELRRWRMECVSKVTNLLDASVNVLRDKSLAKHFAYNKPLKTPVEITGSASGIIGYSSESSDRAESNPLDPLLHIQSLRLHLYCTQELGLEVLERVNLVNKLHEFTSCYNTLLTLASTPLPFPLVQMGRAFLLIWTFSMPLVLLEGPFSDIWSAQIFLFFLTYGFIGLELVSVKLSDPFGNGRDDVPILGLRDAAIIGIENDLNEISVIQATISERRRMFSQQKTRQRRERRSRQTQSGINL